MMSEEKPNLEKLGKELYKREGSEEVEKRGEEITRLGWPKFTKKDLPANDGDSQAGRFADVATRRAVKAKKLLWYGGIGGAALVVLLVLIGGVGLWRSLTQVGDDQILLSIGSVNEIRAGEDVTYVFEYGNDSRVGWENVELEFTPADNFVLTEADPAFADAVPGRRSYLATLGELGAGDKGRVEMKGVVVGEQGSTARSMAEVFFTPKNFPSGKFSKSVVHTATVTSLSLDLALEAADEAAAGERILVKIQARNVGDSPLSGGYIEVGAAAGMQLASEDPEFSGEFSLVTSRWLLPELMPDSSLQRTLVIYLTGEPGEKRELQVMAGLVREGRGLTQRTVAHTFALAETELKIAQTFNKEKGTLVVHPDERLEAKITYENTGNVGLSNAVVRAVFEGPGLDESKLNLRDGAYDTRTKTITWSAASVPELELVGPGSKGELTYSFGISPLANFPTEGEVLENFGLVATVSIDSPDVKVPLGEERKLVSDRSVLSVESPMILEADAFYDDGRLGIESSGPLPPKVNEETTYTVRLKAGTALNDMGDTRVVAVLPEGVKYMDKIFKTTGEVVFEERTGQVIWTIPFVEAGTGRRTPPSELHMQVAIVPAENQKGQSVKFLNAVTAEGKDQFTETTVTKELSGFDLPSTQTADQSNGFVE